MKDNKEAAIERIRKNISTHGHHVYLVVGAACPRFAYTIGLSPSIGYELILAGAAFYTADEMSLVLNNIAAQLRRIPESHTSRFELESKGVFTLGEVDDSWASKMLLRVFDYYKVSKVRARQVIPDTSHSTIDVPNLSEPWNEASEPVWRWFEKPWEYPASKQSQAVTNLEALKGKRITEAVRWEENEWELFAGAGCDVKEEDIRVVPLGVLLGADQSLEDVLGLEVGKGIWRDANELKWQQWRKRSESAEGS